MRYARAIHEMAKKAKVAVLGTGVNPGFAMDALPITLTGVCERVDSIRVDRIQDARVRRLPFQQKIGAGLTREQFQKKVDDAQRAARRAGRIGLDDRRRDGLEAGQDHRRDPAEDRRPRPWPASSSRSIAGYVCGIIQDGIGYRNGEPVITLHMEAYLGAPESYDAVDISRLAEHQVEDRGRRARRRGHGVDHGELDPEDPRGRARPAHDARHADSVVLRWRSLGSPR